VRELKNLVERFVVLESSEVIEPHQLPQWIHTRSESVGQSAGGRFVLPESGLSLDELQKDLIIQALERANNNMTLAAVIIVMGMIVDDAIVVAENITRMRRQGVAPEEAAIEGARFVAIPIIAAVVTTCVAFLPLLFIEDRFGALIRVIPPIINYLCEDLLIGNTRKTCHLFIEYGNRHTNSNSKGTAIAKEACSCNPL